MHMLVSGDNRKNKQSKHETTWGVEARSAGPPFGGVLSPTLAWVKEKQTFQIHCWWCLQRDTQTRPRKEKTERKVHLGVKQPVSLRGLNTADWHIFCLTCYHLQEPKNEYYRATSETQLFYQNSNVWLKLRVKSVREATWDFLCFFFKFSVI